MAIALSVVSISVRAQGLWDVEYGGGNDYAEKWIAKGWVPTFREPAPFTPWLFFAVSCGERGLEFYLVGEPAHLIQRRINDTLFATISPVPDTLPSHDILADTTELIITIAPRLAAQFDEPPDTAHIRLIVDYEGRLAVEEIAATWFLETGELLARGIDADLCVRYPNCTPRSLRDFVGDVRHTPGIEVLPPDLRPGWYALVGEDGCRVTWLESVPLGRRKHGLMNTRTGEGYVFLRRESELPIAPLPVGDGIEVIYLRFAGHEGE